jgi:hypothetical protein
MGRLKGEGDYVGVGVERVCVRVQLVPLCTIESKRESRSQSRQSDRLFLQLSELAPPPPNPPPPL